jgi:hypothetical protein
MPGGIASVILVMTFMMVLRDFGARLRPGRRPRQVNASA